MKKSRIPLFIMSIISVMIAEYNAAEIIQLRQTAQNLSTAGNGIPEVLARVSVGVAANVSSVLLVAALIFGTVGLACCIPKNPRFALACIILDAPLLVYTFFSVVSDILHRSRFWDIYMPVLAFSVLYMAGAVIAFTDGIHPPKSYKDEDFLKE